MDTMLIVVTLITPTRSSIQVTSGSTGPSGISLQRILLQRVTFIRLLKNSWTDKSEQAGKSMGCTPAEEIDDIPVGPVVLDGG
jgi:hypothetical protein